MSKNNILRLLAVTIVFAFVSIPEIGAQSETLTRLGIHTRPPVEVRYRTYETQIIRPKWNVQPVAVMLPKKVYSLKSKQRFTISPLK